MKLKKIVVPSLGRAGTAASMAWLPKSGRQVVFAVHKDEAATYRQAYPTAEVLVLSDKCRKHVGLVRKEIMRKLREPFFFVDDDIRLSLKTAPDVRAVFDTLERHMKHASIAGLGQQLFSNYAIASAKDFNGDKVHRNKFVATVYAVDPVVFDDCPLEDLPVYEDVAVVVHAARRGKGVIVSYCATHSNVSPPTGGCNSWRGKELTLKSLEKLVALYPDICTVRQTKNTTHSQDIGVGLRVAWAKLNKEDK